MITFNDLDVDTLEFLGEQESQYLVGLDHYTEEIESMLSGDLELTGAKLPWGKTHDYLRFRPGETTIWAGVNGHGKSMVSGMAAAWMMSKQVVCIASLEMPVRHTVNRILRQIFETSKPSKEQYRRLLDWNPENFVIYDQLDTVPADRILGMLHYAAQNCDVKHVFIDSLVKCGLGIDDYNSQARFMDKLCWTAKAENIHIHIVMHMRKGRAETDKPGKFDVKGAGELTDLADNVLVCWRNKHKEQQHELLVAGEANEYDEKAPDTVLTVHKQRHGEWEGSINLWFDPMSQSYAESMNGDAPMFPW